MISRNTFNRRSFLRHAGKAGALPLLQYAPLLASNNAAAACNESAPRSLVCVFLLGGADSFNFVVPSGAAYTDYLATRGAMAVTDDSLLTANDSLIGEIGFNDMLPGLHDLYQNQQLAVVSNVGNLVQPTSKAQFSNSQALPQDLFAHNSQQKLWQTGSGDLAVDAGWGGSIAQNIADCNNATNVATSISIAGSNSWLSNLQQSYVSLSPNADIQRMRAYADSSTTVSTLEQLLAQSKANSSSPFAQEAAHGITRSRETANNLYAALQEHTVDDMVPTTDLALQLHLVARLISAREQLGMGKQVFFVGLGGWDTHSNQNQRMVPLLNELNTALTSFQTTINNMGKSNSVTTFTASDFGRTLTTNGDGTDHGWGGHALVMGGAVNGGKIYGSFPSFASVDNPNDAGDGDNFAGRIIPSISVAQYGATLADWMGTSNAERDTMLPNLSNFAIKNLGFMA